jgi:hypothetical protein
MQVDDNTTFNKTETVRKLKNNAVNGLNCGQEIERLISHYLSVEKTNEFNSVAATSLIMLLCMAGNHEEANSRRSKYKVK